MSADLAWAEQHILDFVRTWTDQKVAEVIAFNDDGRMEYNCCCGCIRGVTLSTTLHTTGQLRACADSGPNHYGKTVWLPGALLAEKGYLMLHPLLAEPSEFQRYDVDSARGRAIARERMAVILRKDQARRDVLRAGIRETFGAEELVHA